MVIEPAVWAPLTIETFLSPKTHRSLVPAAGVILRNGGDAIVQIEKLARPPTNGFLNGGVHTDGAKVELDIALKERCPMRSDQSRQVCALDLSINCFSRSRNRRPIFESYFNIDGIRCLLGDEPIVSARQAYDLETHTFSEPVRVCDNRCQVITRVAIEVLSHERQNETNSHAWGVERFLDLVEAITDCGIEIHRIVVRSVPSHRW